METFFNIMFWFGVALMAFGSWMGIRNNKVGSFRHNLINLCSKSAKRYIFDNVENWRKPYVLFDKYSYAAMLFSFKRLKLEAWFTEDEIKVLKHGNDD